MSEEITKVCKKHGNLTSKSIYLRKRNGFTYLECRKCNKEKSNAWVAANKEKCLQMHRIYSKNYTALNPKKRKESLKKYYQKNTDKIISYAKQRFVKNKEKIKAVHKQYVLKNKEKINKKRKEWREQLKDSYIAYLLQTPTKILKEYPDLIATKRITIFLKREINKLKQGEINDNPNS